MVAKLDPNRCSKTLFHRDAWNRSQCARKGVVEEEGTLWCKQHAPSAVKQRREASEKSWVEKNKAEHQRRVRHAWLLVLGMIREENPKLADEVQALAEKLDVRT